MTEPTRTTPNSTRGRRRLNAVLVVLAALPLGCSVMGGRGQSLVPTRYQVRTGPFLIYSNTPITGDWPAIRCLHALEADLGAHLNYRARADEEPVEIYVLTNRNAYIHFLRFYYPELPPRRAFFLAQGDRRVVYTYLSDRLEEDLRHESTHALVRGYYGDLPLWLDEGLAEYFETRPDAIDARDEHLTKLPQDLKQGWVPDLARLEGLNDIHQMSPRDYREAWAWVHLMLARDGPGKSILLDYLGAIRTAPQRPALSKVLDGRGVSPQSLVAHIEKLQTSVLARSPEPPPPPSGDHLIRFQDHPSSEPAAARAAPSSRLGLLKRIGSFLGF